MRNNSLILTRKILSGILLLLATFVVAQRPRLPKNGENLVPNPGFESFGNIPIGWTYKGADFGRVVQYWFSGTTASPDIYGPGVKVPRDWAEKGFGDEKPHSGEAMAGFTLYGCVNGKPHCREYIEIQLKEPLIIGQTYEVSFWVAPMKKSLWVNNLGAYFSVSPIERKTDEILIRDVQVQMSEIVKPASRGNWVKVNGRFKATYEAEHILIGNFNDDNTTLTEASGDDSYNYAYYYLDDVMLRKIPPYLTPVIKDDDLTKIPLKKGQTIALKNIYFEFDKADLMPRSYVELFKLLKVMKANPKLKIDIAGHTDSIGSEDYNMDLSRRRALSVVNFLRGEGIPAKRLQSHGVGELRPVATNETDEGRAENRRVEFTVLER